MIQVLDLARENVALKDEVARLRKELAELVQTHGSNGTEPSCSCTQPDIDDAPRSTSAAVWIAARLVLVMPRHLALGCGLSGDGPGGLPDCTVIVDRRLTERRRAAQADYRGDERRRRDRRSDQRSTPGAVVVSLR